jgi:CBS domain-containing protein
MTVSRILTEKGREVITTKPERTLHEASVELTRHGVGALVVVNDIGQIVGLLTERDIVRAVAQHGTGALIDPVSRFMVTNPKVASEDDTIDATMSTMTLQRCRHLPVVHRGQLAGLVSIGDVVKHRIQAIEYEHKVLLDYIATA